MNIGMAEILIGIGSICSEDSTKTKLEPGSKTLSPNRCHTANETGKPVSFPVSNKATL